MSCFIIDIITICLLIGSVLMLNYIKEMKKYLFIYVLLEWKNAEVHKLWQVTFLHNERIYLMALCNKQQPIIYIVY